MNRRPLFLPVSIDDIEEFAVTVGRCGRFLHAGVLYRVSDHEVQMLHLTVEGKVESIPPDDHFCWAIPRLHASDVVHADLLRQLSVLCAAVAASGQQLYYGFRYAPSTFSTTDGTLTLGGKAIGLTCSTFVMCICNSLNIRLLDGPWQIRAEDIPLREKILEYLKNNQHHYGIPAHIIQQNEVDASDIHCMRYSPGDVLSAGIAVSVPISFQVACDLGIDAIAWVDDMKSIVDRRP